MARIPKQISSIARDYSESAIRRLARIMNDDDAPEAAQIAAAKELLDRGYGKAPLSVDLNHGVQDNLAALLEQISGKTRGLPT